MIRLIRKILYWIFGRKSLLSTANSSDWILEAVYVKYNDWITFFTAFTLTIWLYYLYDNFWVIVFFGGLRLFITYSTYVFTTALLNMSTLLPLGWLFVLAVLTYWVFSRYTLPLKKRQLYPEYLKTLLLSISGLVIGGLGLISADFIETFAALEGISIVVLFMFMQGFGQYSMESLFLRFFINNVYCTMTFSYGITLFLYAGKCTNYHEFRLALLVKELLVTKSYYSGETFVIHDLWKTFIYLGFVCVIISFFFKLGGYPFQSIVPDLFAGSSLVFLIYYVVFIKVYYMYILSKFVYGAFLGWSSLISPVVFLAGIFSIVHGTYATLFEADFIKFIGTSSVPQMGLVLLGFSLANNDGLELAYFFILVYVSTTLLLIYTFCSLQLKRVPAPYRLTQKDYEPTNGMPLPETSSRYPADVSWADVYDSNAHYTQYANNFFYVSTAHLRIRATQHGDLFATPYLTQAAVFCSFAALPPFIGFFSKYYLILEYAAAWPLIILWLLLVLNIISSFYYLQLVLHLIGAVRMALRQHPEKKRRLSSIHKKPTGRFKVALVPGYIKQNSTGTNLLITTILDICVFRAMLVLTFVFSTASVQAAQTWIFAFFI